MPELRSILGRGHSWGHPSEVSSRGGGPSGRGGGQRRIALLSWLSLALVAGMSFLYLLQAQDVSSLGYEIRRLEAEKSRLLERNAQLTLDIAGLKALSRIRARATQLGLGPPERLGYIRLSGGQLAGGGLDD